MFAVVQADAAASVIGSLAAQGIPSWAVGEVSTQVRDLADFEQGAKGVNGGAVRLTGSFA
jgi:phosphoribosylformylglycinamidine cyclo-ligase